MNESKDKRMNELSKLKIRIKKWEKDFFRQNGRKASKTDIDSDLTLKSDYKKYWNLMEKSNRKDIWNKGLNKRANGSGIDPKNSVLDSFSKKMFDKYIKDNNTFKPKEQKTSYSLRRKPQKQTEESVDNQPIGDQSVVAKEITSSVEAIVSNEPKLNSVLIRSKSIEESILRSMSNEFNTNNEFNKQSKDESNVFSKPFVDNNLINDIIISLDLNIDTNTTRNENCVQRQDSGIGADCLSDPLSNDSLNLNDLEISSSKTRIKRKSDVFDFEEEIEDKSEPKPVKKRIYADLDFDSDYMSHSNESKQSVDSNESTNGSNKKNKFFVSKDRTNRLKTTLNAYKRTMNTIIKCDDNSIVENEKQINKTINSKTSLESNESEPNDGIKEKKKTKKSKPKAIETNFKRLNMKKKVFASRGYRKFNIRKYKRLKWRQTVDQNRNICYKCGASGHWAKECRFEDKLDSDVLNDELKGLGVSKAVEDLQQTIPIKSLLMSDSDEEKECSLSDALIIMGHKAFRPNQELAIKRILSAKSCLLIASTGSGKSLCYQLPAYLYWKHRKAITLVISPLISLMEDQLTTFPKGLKAVCIHSGLSQSQKQSALDSLLSGEAQVILMSPEAITGGSTCINLNALPPIGFVCIDEAHCLSEWSNNFRPSYLQLYRVLKDKLKIQTFLALTATATKKTALTIARTLGLDPQNDIIGTTLVPENLVLTVSRDSNKELALIDLLKSDRFNGLKSIIIYCTRREQTERLASLIRISFQEIRQTNAKTGKSRIVWDAQAYHAGKTPEERNRVQKRFIRGDLRVIVATIAFGMGINKSNIRAIIHYNLPKSFENYMQEIGRAGRDGLEAHCHLFLDSDGTDLFELQRHIYANSTDRKCLRKLIEKVFKPCKCRTIFDAEDDNPPQLESEELAHKADNVCAGHEIAFPIQSTVLELDLKEETILTLITYIELDFSVGKVHLLAPINSMCTLLCYGNGSEQMKAISRTSPSVAIALTLYQRNNSSKEIPNQIKFDLVEVCSMLGRTLSDVRNELRGLEWQESNGRKKRTNVRVMFSDLSFHLRSVGDLSEEQMNECLEFLSDFTQIQESNEVSKLRNVYLTFKQYSQTYCTNRVNQTKCLQLKNELNHYFNDDNIEDQNIDLVNDHKFNQLLAGSHVNDLEQARRDVRDLLSIHGVQTLGSARVIARILQGIPSPRFPAEVWGKCRRFWRSDISVNFNDLLKIANEELIRLKSF